MHIRISTYKVTDEAGLMSAADDMRDELKGIPGVVSIEAVKFSDEDFMTIAKYESVEAAEASADRAKEIFGRLAHCLDASTLQQQTGEVVWEM